MKACIILTVLGALLLIYYIIEKIRKYCVYEVLIKATLSVLFIAVAAISMTVSGAGTFGILVLLGLVFGLLGDIWLDLKFVYPHDDTIYTYAGFIVFAVGHILFLTGLYLTYADFARPMYLILPVVFGIALGIGNIQAGPLMKLDFGRFKLITGIYGAILTTFAATCGSLALMHGFDCASLNVLFVGSVLFMLSDFVLSGTYFGGKERKVDITLNYLFYYSAQFLIALSLLYV